MNLHERFIEQQKVKPTELQKMRIYQKFLDKSQRNLGLGKIAHYMKVWVFSFVVLIIWGASYFALQGDSWYQIVKNKSGYQIVTPRAGEAQANVLWKIVKSKGEISIINTKNNIKITTDTLHEDEHILLGSWAEIEFIVRDNVRAKIIGPAEVGLQYLGTQKGVDNYAINLISGDYFEIVSIDKTSVGKQLGRGEIHDEEKASAIDHIIVQSPEFSIETKQVSGNINIVMSKKANGTREVENKWSEVVMKTIIEDEQKFIAIASHQTVAINGNVDFVDVDIEKLKQEIKDKQFTVRYEIKQDDDTSSIGTAMVDATTIADILEETKTPEKKVMDEMMLNRLDDALNPSFLDRDLVQIQKYYNEKNVSAFTIAYNNLLIKLRAGYEAVWLTAPSFPVDEQHLAQGASMAENLANTIVRTYYIDTSHLVGLYVTANTLHTLSWLWIEQTQEQTVEQQKVKQAIKPLDGIIAPKQYPKDDEQKDSTFSLWSTKQTIEDQLKTFGIE